ncbi:aspartoacylase [Saccharospirillum salsuginis]|uniref:Aspartoacylase n=1 Tax=Saccharospirillum salsuginis TaxID=418750 RepID=A0A918K6N2_9GAMM|nr:aspartoacylase [Saccharospirillum salsuginis]GGX50109.1 putative aspartoacylase [Saccharospirillum salsuginis]
MAAIKHVAITGGTHGNELTGVHLLKYWRNNPEIVCRDSFVTELHLANPKANGCNRRYLDQDLNRQFNWDDLNNHELCGYEQNRAKSLNTLLGPKDEPRVDFVIDLHTTTANMGTTLVIKSDDPLVVGMAFYVKEKMPDVTLFYEPEDRMRDNFLISLGRKHGLVVEVGPIPQGLLRWDIYDQTRQATELCLDFLQAFNTGDVPSLPDIQPGFQFVEKVHLPENERGELTAMVHPNLQDADYQPIHPGDPLFMTLNGDTLPYEGTETLFGAFINEAAYYDRHVGLSLMRPVDIQLPKS